ncbi:MAG: hypothetical protein K9G62_03375 [Alphaproteobacteria bacterium]|nr:hypothetical protein [Alphaproteobacteria bacterium]
MRGKILCGCALVLLATVGGISLYFAQRGGSPAPAPAVTGRYSVIADGRTVVAGQLDSEAGRLIVLSPAPETADAGRADYNIRFHREAAPVEMSLKFDNKDGIVSVSGSGLAEFTDVVATQGSSLIRGKSDWAGRFSEKMKSGGGSLKLALFGNDPLGGAPSRPLIIEVLDAPGGGGPTSEGVNEYTLRECGNPKLSICLGDKLDKVLEKIVANYVTSLLMMTEQLSAVMMQYVQGVGMLMDGKQQLETERLHQKLSAEAHKDYHPSNQMCRFGSMIKSAARDERKGAYEKQALNKIMMNSYLNTKFDSSAPGASKDMAARLRQFRETYCDIWDHSDVNGAGLIYICQWQPSNRQITPGENIGAAQKKRINKDIDFTRTAWLPLTLELDFTDKTPLEPSGQGKDPKLSADEEDVIALAHNLYWPQALDPAPASELEKDPAAFMNARNLWAMHNVAHNSFASLVAMKANADPGTNHSGGDFVKALMKEFGLSGDVDKLLGSRPSYYAQMEVLTKKIYQNPDFYTNLYDTPANVNRIGVTLDAIKLMQMRDWHEASMRREMTTSLLIEEGLMKHVAQLSDEMGTTAGRGR